MCKQCEELRKQFKEAYSQKAAIKAAKIAMEAAAVMTGLKKTESK